MAVAEHRKWALWPPVLTWRRSHNWVSRYQLAMIGADAACGLLAGAAALLGRFPGPTQPELYVATTIGLPVVWVACVAAVGGYDPRFIGLGSESSAGSSAQRSA